MLFFLKKKQSNFKKNMKTQKQNKNGFLELNFSDLSAEEKDKYMQFLVQNSIFFEEEKENNNYIATIKFLQNEEKKNNPISLKPIKQNIKPNSFGKEAFTLARSSVNSQKNKIKLNKNTKIERKELNEIQNFESFYYLKIL